MITDIKYYKNIDNLSFYVHNLGEFEFDRDGDMSMEEPHDRYIHIDVLEVIVELYRNRAKHEVK